MSENAMPPGDFLWGIDGSYLDFSSDFQHTENQMPPLPRTSNINNPQVSTIPPVGADGLRFGSRVAAEAIVDSVFREPLRRVTNDDVDTVVCTSREHVQALFAALKHTEHMPCPPTRNTLRSAVVATTPAERADWEEWQNSAQTHAAKNIDDTEMSQAKVELRAWQIFDEIVEVHRTGFRFTKQTKDHKSTCSARIVNAVVAIRRFAIVRQKLLEGDKIWEFASNPTAYADTTVRSHHNNATRARARNGGSNQSTTTGNTDTTTAGGAQPTNTTTRKGRRGTVANGAIHKRNMPTQEVKKRKREAAQEKRQAAAPNAEAVHRGEAEIDQQGHDDTTRTPLADEPSFSMSRRREVYGNDDTSFSMYESVDEAASAGFNEDNGYDEDDVYGEDEEMQDGSASSYHPTAAPAHKRRKH